MSSLITFMQLLPNVARAWPQAHRRRRPRPDYWVSLLWHKLMDRTVLDPKLSNAPNAYVYAQCLKGRPGGVVLLVVNADQQRAFNLSVPNSAERYTLTAKPLESTSIDLNGHTLQLDSNDNLPSMTGEPVRAGRVTRVTPTIPCLPPTEGSNDSH